ncbi:transglutaminaseTgpA domain-containing protein [Bifidobacterium scaligerum]|uniref:Transglutaminase-like domain-containing protein n=1 Tax=Bifidobacterium scaligerum TaxID=2052656 RepID=A0A2M9HRS1_9BIFI|nr:transglutaminaseTgpA domain-containing protein [Bifidobacterium scaligerum]PJM79487.1 hypothetical protein CUU80_05635 [Bifidobacterium scaligerum]
MSRVSRHGLTARRLVRHGLIRPTWGGALLLVAAGGCCFGGLLLDERTLMDASIAFVVVFVCALVLVVLQWCGVIAIGQSILSNQIEQRDSYGTVVSRVVGDLPERRGWYVTVSTVVRWTSPLGLIAARKVVPGGGQTLIVPAVDEHTANDASVVNTRQVGSDQSAHSGGVRAYAPGDPLKLISWRHTAHRGELMTRESSRDVPATIVLALNTGGVTVEELDAEVAALLPYVQVLRDTGRTERLIVTDGMQTFEGSENLERFFAAVQPYAMPAASSASGDRRPSHASSVKKPELPSVPERASAIVRTATNGQGAVQVLICDGTDSQALATALRHSPIADKLTVLDPADTEPSATSAYRHIDVQTVSPADRTMRMGLDKIPEQRTFSNNAGRVRLPRLVYQLLPHFAGAAALTTFFGVALTGLSGLISPDGMWIWFAAALLGLAALGTAVQSTTRMRSILRFVAYTMFVLIATAALAVVRFRQIAAAAHAQVVEEETSRATQYGIASDLASGSSSRWKLFGDVINTGFDQLNIQLPPLKVSEASDLFLILAVAALAVAVRCLLVFRPLIPAMVVLPVAVLAADYALVGHLAPLWAIGLTVAAFPLVLFAAHPGRSYPVLRLGRPRVSSKRSGTIRTASTNAGRTLTATPFIVAVLAAAITLPLSGPAALLAYRVPLSIGEGGGMFTSNTVNPMIDLKRNIAAGSDDTVLTYRSYKRLYLRLTTLDNFDGDTWGYDRQFALDAGLYGSGIQLGRNSEDELSRYDRMMMNPLGAYMAALGYTGYDVAVTDPSSLERFMVNADIRIDTLKSRFLPVPGNVTYLDNGVGGDWLLYQDGTVYNRTTGTSSDLEYGADGNAIDPITTASGFSQLSQITSAQSVLLGDTDVTDDDLQRWYQARRDLADTGLAEVHRDTAGDFLVIRATINSDGSVTGANGWRLGAGSFQGETATFLDSTSAPTPSSVVFDDTIVKQLGFGKDNYILGFGSGGSMVIVTPLDASMSSVDADAQSGAPGAASSSRDIDAWANRVFSFLHKNTSLSVYTVVNGSIPRANQSIARMQWYVDASDRRAHENRYTSLPEKLPANVQSVIDQAQAAGIPIKGRTYDDQVRAMRWLVDYFTNPDNAFTYSLDAPDGDGRDNLDVLDDFLDPDNGHAGYCQHYASALAVLGRSLGVPTRIVLGYNAGVSNRDKNGFFVVQSKQLHAWTEAYLNGVGWVPFDVTPATAENGSAASDAASAGTDSTSDNTSDSGDGTDVTATPDASADDSADSSGDAADQSDASDTRSFASRRNTNNAAGNAGNGDGWMLWWISNLDARLVARGILLGLLAAVALVGLCLGVPRLCRRMRRRRVLAAIAQAQAHRDDGDLSARAWRMTWREVVLTARVRAKRHARARAKSPGKTQAKSSLIFQPSQTDMDIARILAERCPEQSDFILLTARNATAAAFRGTTDSVQGLASRFRAFLQ